MLSQSNRFGYCRVSVPFLDTFCPHFWTFWSRVGVWVWQTDFWTNVDNLTDRRWAHRGPACLPLGPHFTNLDHQQIQVAIHKYKSMWQSTNTTSEIRNTDILGQNWICQQKVTFDYLHISLKKTKTAVFDQRKRSCNYVSTQVFLMVVMMNKKSMVGESVRKVKISQMSNIVGI